MTQIPIPPNEGEILPVPNGLHTEVFRTRTEVEFIVHPHQPMAGTIAGRPLRPAPIPWCEHFAHPVPLYDCPNLANDPQKGRPVLPRSARTTCSSCGGTASSAREGRWRSRPRSQSTLSS